MRRIARGRSRAAAAALLSAAALLAAEAHSQLAPGRKGSAADLAAIAEEVVTCPEGSVERIIPWSETGYSKGCYRDGIPHGTIIFWEKGYLNLRGSYFEGEKDGEWTVFHENGARYVTIRFERGAKKGKTYYSTAHGGAVQR